MRDDRSLGTGMIVMALIRAIESYRPERERLFDDRFSRGLVPGLWKVLLLPGLRHALVALAEARGPGALGNLYCRTRYIDDALRNALDGGVGQVVILGAGFDARAYRISGIAKARVFELDLPTPQRLKQARLERILGALPDHVTFIPIDFDRQDIEREMATEGYRAGVETFFIWEGVTQYITARAVDATLRYVTRTAPAGSGMVFTYIDRAIVGGTARSEADQTFVSAARRGGMPWIFGIAPSEVAEYLAERHLRLVEEVWAPHYQARYLKPRGRRMAVFEGERVVVARVVARDGELKDRPVAP